MKTKYMLIIYFICIMLFCLIGIRIFNFSDNLEVYKSPSVAYKEGCEYYLLNDIESNKEFIYNDRNYQLNDEMCYYIIDNYNKVGSFFLYYDKIISSSIFSFLFPMFVPVFVLIPVIYVLSKEFDSSYILYFLQRKSYKKYILHLFKESYKYFFPIFLILFFVILCALKLSNGVFDPRMDIYRSFTGEHSLLFFDNITNCIIYFVIILFNVLTFINFGLISISHNKNFYIALIESFLISFLFNCFIFIFVGLTLQTKFGIIAESINVFEIFRWHNITNPKLFLVINIIYYLVSLFFVYLSYRKKERIIKLCEV